MLKDWGISLRCFYCFMLLFFSLVTAKVAHATVPVKLPKRFSLSKKSKSLRIDSLKDSESSAFNAVYDGRLKRERKMKRSLIIHFREGASEQTISNFLSSNKLQDLKELRENYHLVRLSSKENDLLNELNRLDEAIASSALIENYDINEYRELALHDLSSNPLARRQWHILNLHH